MKTEKLDKNFKNLLMELHQTKNADVSEIIFDTMTFEQMLFITMGKANKENLRKIEESFPEYLDAVVYYYEHLQNNKEELVDMFQLN